MGNGTSSSHHQGDPIETLDHHGQSINVMALSGDGTIVVTGSDDNTARIWSANGDKTECIGVLKGHTSYITCLSVVEAVALTGSADGTVKKWDLTSCECLFTFQGHTSKIQK